MIAARPINPIEPDIDDELPDVPGTPPTPTPTPTSPVCSDVSDNDGVTFLAHCCNGGEVVPWQHDARDHCFTTNTDMCGANSSHSLDPLSTSCPGRCGSGCNALEFYTQDCLDHDLCLMPMDF